MRCITLFFAVGLSVAPSADAALLIYNFDSADLGIHGEITFEDTNPNFAASSTVSIANGGVVDFFFEQGGSFWTPADGTSIFFLSFNANGTSPDDIFFYGWNAVDTVAPNATGIGLTFNSDLTTNGNHLVGIIDGGLTSATDGTFSQAGTNVPEPASLWLLSGTGVLALARNRRRQSQTSPGRTRAGHEAGASRIPN